MNEEQQLYFQNKRIEYNNITYSLNEKDNTASIVSCLSKIYLVFIPRSINYESKEYIVTSILKYAFNNRVIINWFQFASDSNLQIIDKYAFGFSNITIITIPSTVTKIGEYAFLQCPQLKTIEIPDDSKLQTIEKNAFYNTPIECITIPSELIELKEGCCCGMSEITEIKVSPKNPRYCCYKGEMIIGKTTIEQENYDCLIFCIPNIQNITIPSFIEHICSHSFSNCKELKTIEIPDDSKLRTIDKYAFSDSLIESPLNLHIKSSLESITIPSELIELKEEWCCGLSKLMKIKVSSKNPRYCCYKEEMIIGKTTIEQENYDCLIFCSRNIQNITIPNFIEHICSFSFAFCKQLKTIEIPNDSKLQTIDEYAFFCSSIESIMIPSTVTTIREDAFYECKYLRQIEIPNDSKLQTIDGGVFSDSLIERITIPSELIELKEGWCYGLSKLTKIKVSSKNPRYCCYKEEMIIGKTTIEQENYDCLIFCIPNIQNITIPSFIEHICSRSFIYSSIESIMIPSTVTTIGICAFCECEHLRQIEISNDSKLQTIDGGAFSDSSIESIIIPSTVTTIGEHAFSYCCCLRRIEIPFNLKIQAINQYTFYFSLIQSITIPSSVLFIRKYAFSNCKQLQKIEISNDSKLQAIDEYAFYDSSIRKIAIPPSVTFIGELAFCNCKKLHKIEIPIDSKLKVINDHAFSCSSIHSITIPSSVTIIGKNAFGNCKNLCIMEIFNQELISMYPTFFKNAKKAIFMIPVYS